MKLEDQCCTLQQAKRLKELGIEQISYFVWGERGVITEGWSIEGYEDIFYSAYNVAELGIMLPPGYDTMKITDNGWAAYDPDGECVLTHYKTEAECRAAMLINLLETAITIEECNKRLTES